MEQVVETRNYILYENERQDLFLKHKNIEGLACFLTSDIKYFIRELVAQND